MTAAAIVHFDYAVLIVPFEDPSAPINPSTALVLRFDPPSIGKAGKCSRGRNIGHYRWVSAVRVPFGAYTLDIEADEIILPITASRRAPTAP